jgi:hypothetical protein
MHQEKLEGAGVTAQLLFSVEATFTSGKVNQQNFHVYNSQILSPSHQA